MMPVNFSLRTVIPNLTVKSLLLVLASLTFEAHAVPIPSGQADNPDKKSIASSGQSAIDVCFSPVEECDQKLLSFIQGATKSIDIAIFDFDLAIISDYLIASMDKLEIRVVVDKRQSKRAGSGVDKLVAAGINVRYGKQKSNGIMHNKFVIIDGTALETGSFNFTNHASTVNNENQIYIRDQDTVAKYIERFEAIYQEGVATKAST